MPGAPDPEPRRVITATSPEGQAVAIGPVVSRASIRAIRDALERHGWTPGDDVIYMSRAELYRSQGWRSPAARRPLLSRAAAASDHNQERGYSPHARPR